MSLTVIFLKKARLYEKLGHFHMMRFADIKQIDPPFQNYIIGVFPLPFCI